MKIEIPLFQELALRIGDAGADEEIFATAPVQKGFILLDKGRSLAEEAIGFGVPVLKRGLTTIFPGDVALAERRSGAAWEITAIYKLDMVEKISRGGNAIVENNLFYTVKNFLAALIRSAPGVRGLLTAASSKLRRMFQWETTYTDAGFFCEVPVVYFIEGETGMIKMEVDASGLPAEITEVILMNEQGAHHFDRYLDSCGISLQDTQIGCWDEVAAEEAWFACSLRPIAFKLIKTRGTKLFRGRELVGSRLAWAGFGCSFKPFARKMRFEMQIERRTL